MCGDQPLQLASIASDHRRPPDHVRDQAFDGRALAADLRQQQAQGGDQHG
jgi:hypothetical protein